MHATNMHARDSPLQNLQERCHLPAAALYGMSGCEHPAEPGICKHCDKQIWPAACSGRLDVGHGAAYVAVV